MAVYFDKDPVRDPSVPPKIHALFPTGDRKDYEIQNTTTVQDLVQMIKDDDSIQKPENRTIAIIYHGKILQPVDILSKIDNLTEYTVHVFYRQISSKPSRKQKNSNQGSESNADAVNADDDDERLDSDLRGFDRLTRMNYTQDQIDTIRRHFHSLQGTTNSSPEEQIEAEEEWFPVIFNTNVLDGGAAGAAQILLGSINEPNRGQNTDSPLQALIRNNHFHQNNRNGGDGSDDPEAGNTNTEEAAAAVEDDNETPSWCSFFFGFIIGLFLGLGSIIFLLTSFNNRSMLAGLFIGTLSHYCITSYLGDV